MSALMPYCLTALLPENHVSIAGIVVAWHLIWGETGLSPTLDRFPAHTSDPRSLCRPAALRALQQLSLFTTTTPHRPVRPAAIPRRLPSYRRHNAFCQVNYCIPDDEAESHPF
jgi:hypothetical protein